MSCSRRRTVSRVLLSLVAPSLAVAFAAQAQEPATPLVVPPYAPPPVIEPAIVSSSSSLSFTDAEGVLDQLALQIVADFGYQEGRRPDLVWASAGIDGARGLHLFSRTMPGGSVRTLEIFTARNPLGDYQIAVMGSEIINGQQSPNPDLGAVRAVAADWLSRVGAARVAAPASAVLRDLALHPYQLSYAQADKAVAVLKALGYPVIEFSQSPGESPFEKLYSPSATPIDRLPAVIKMIDATKTSILDPIPNELLPPAQPVAFPTARREAIPEIGGSFLFQQTASDSTQRLLLAYDRGDPRSLATLLRTLTEEIDTPARQVVISALVVEVNRDRLRDLGVTFEGSDGRNSISFSTDALGEQLPLTYTYDENQPRGSFRIKATLAALVERGEAEILSNPSVLVIDGRQARIQIGQQVPVVSSTSTAAGIISSVEYFPVGIVLNIRPRISSDAAEVSMQVETIVSAVAQTSQSVSAVFFAPTIDNRQVQTFVRVADNTPFIIGGLISSDRQKATSGIPLLSRIPGLGALFRRENLSSAKREVIVVLTPHIVPLQEKNFSFVIPKDADRFDSFGNELSRNSYRLRQGDLYDLGFVYESRVFQSLVAEVRERAQRDPSMTSVEPFASLLDGQAPGEDILVRRMLYEIARKSDYKNGIEPGRMLFFRETDEAGGDGFEVSFLEQYLSRLDGENNALVLSFDAGNSESIDHPFVQPTARIHYEYIAPGGYQQRLRELNTSSEDGTGRWAIILSDADAGSSTSLEILQSVLLLKQILNLNTSLPLEIDEFYVGRQIVFPTKEDIDENVHVIDRQVARLFYQVKDYYRAFEQEFNRQVASSLERLRKR